MKNKRLSLRISERRMRVLPTYAATKDKTITSLVEDWIDSLSSERVRSSSLSYGTLREREAPPTTNDPD
ncbi:hypothetical protein [Nostoc sp. NMS4]|uniref:hypothetical protein n=1 Tax=Nostoc sp. NMS4 TaxID=2815390 RepID=UPI0025E5FF49|nr:hypothetical protein [Nostoc sp. NMS4]MBN3924133.1 hypothetical protein [Nostoc sp. NMS4]